MARKNETPTNVATLAGAYYKTNSTPAILQARHALECTAARVSPMLACGASLSPVLSAILANVWGGL